MKQFKSFLQIRYFLLTISAALFFLGTLPTFPSFYPFDRAIDQTCVPHQARASAVTFLCEYRECLFILCFSNTILLNFHMFAHLCIGYKGRVRQIWVLQKCRIFLNSFLEVLKGSKSYKKLLYGKKISQCIATLTMPDHVAMTVSERSHS